jgi:hypothetical protein
LCDVPEVCNGISNACPADGFNSNAVLCRAALSECELQAICSGMNASCPPNPLKTFGTLCGTPPLACENQAVCTGTSASCPSKTLKSGILCGAPASACETQGACNGATPFCPGNAPKPSGTTCNSTYQCTGSVCPASCSSISPNCASDATCVLGACVHAHLMFLSSTTVPGGIGVGQMNAICASLAGGAGLPNAFGFKALVSAGSVPAFDAVPSTGAFILAGSKTLVANDRADLFDGTITVPISTDENGNPMPTGAGDAWTGSQQNGMTSSSCVDWTSNSAVHSGTVGSSGSTNANWVNAVSQPCSTPTHLYCFGP